MNKLTSDIHFFCCYYQAEVFRPEAWFVVAVLKSFDHLSMDRTINTDQSVFEFFVSPEMEGTFLQLMHYFESNHLVKNVRKMPNRLLDATQQV